MKKLILPLIAAVTLFSSCGQIAKSVDWSAENEAQYKESMKKEFLKSFPEDKAAYMTDCIVNKMKAAGMKPLESGLDENQPKIQKMGAECGGEWETDNAAKK